MSLFNKETYETTISIEGMHCDGCVKRVTGALSKIKGVKEVNVSLQEKKAKVVSKKELVPEYIKAVIGDLGFKAVEIK